MLSVISVKKENLKKLGYDSLQHWLQNPNHVYIGRDMSFYVKGANKSKWANPYSVKKYSLEQACELYLQHLQNNPQLLSELYELKGKVLGCWCRSVENTSE